MLWILQVIWTVLIEAIPTVGKNTQQVRAAIQKQVKAYEKLLNAFCGSARVEASLIVHVQVCCSAVPGQKSPQLRAPLSEWDKRLQGSLAKIAM